MGTKDVTFPSGDLQLEGRVSLPEKADCPAVVVCHPHPLYGGSMDNNVVDAISEKLTGAGIAALKFNFRGVGRSQGSFGQGADEGDDARAALDYLAAVPGVDSQRLGLAGYSAGAAFALPAVCGDPRLRALAAISPPPGMADWTAFKTCPKRKLIIFGGNDDFTPVAEVLAFVESLAGPKEYEVITAADHFWWGYEEEMALRVSDFFVRAFE